MKNLIAAATVWRRRNGYKGRGGVVLIHRGQCYGWKNELRDPQHECPGGYAVDEGGNIWLATGGNPIMGAKEWTQIAMAGQEPTCNGR